MGTLNIIIKKCANIFSLIVGIAVIQNEYLHFLVCSFQRFLLHPTALDISKGDFNAFCKPLRKGTCLWLQLWVMWRSLISPGVYLFKNWRRCTQDLGECANVLI